LQQVQIRIHSNNGEENNTNKTILVKPEHGKFRGDIWTYSMNKKEDGASVVGPFPLCTSDALEMEVSVSNWHETLRETVSIKYSEGDVWMMRDDETLSLRLSDLISVEATVGNLIVERDVERVEPGGFVLKKNDKNHVTFTLTSVTLSVSGLLRKSLDHLGADRPGLPLAVPSYISSAAALGGGKGLLEDNLALKLDNHKLLYACEQFKSIEIRLDGSRVVASCDVATQGRPGGALGDTLNDDSFWTIDCQDHPLDLPLSYTIKFLISGIQQEGDFIVSLHDDTHQMAFSQNIKLFGQRIGDLGENAPESIDFIHVSRPCSRFGQVVEEQEPPAPTLHFRVDAIQLHRSLIQHILDSGVVDLEK